MKLGKIGASIQYLLVRTIRYVRLSIISIQPKRKRILLAVGIILFIVLPAVLIVNWNARSATAVSASQGPRTATATGDCVEDASAGTAVWTSPGDAFSDNATYASTSVDGTTSRYIKCTNFGFNIPTGVTISGIVVTVERKSNGTGNGGSKDAAVRTIKGGTIGTTDRSTATLYTTADVSEDHGTSSDLWGNTWTVGDINANNFGAAIAVTKASAAGAAHTVTVDVVTITVHYTFNPTFTQSSYRWFENQDISGANGFVKAFGGSSDDLGSSVVLTSDGGYAVTGYTSSYGAGSPDMFLAKYDSSGTLSWSRTWGGTGDERGASLVQTSDGGYAVTGYTLSYGAGGRDMFLAKYDSSGTLSWSRTWGGTGAEKGASLVQTSDGGYAVTGNADTFAGVYSDMFLAKYDSSGTLSWSRTWGGAGSVDSGISLVQTSDGGYAVTGDTSSYGSGGNASDMFLAKYDSSGTLSWSRTWGGSGFSEKGNSLVQTSDGGYAVTGNTSSYGAGDSDMFLAKYDSSGTLSWSRTWGGIGTDDGRSLVQTSDGGYAVTGGTASYGAGNYDVYLAKYDSSGTLSWSRTWGSFGYNSGDSLVVVPGQGYAVAGGTANYGAGMNDILLVKYDSSGNISSGCSSPMCQSPTATTSSPTATTSSPTATTSSPTATTSSPTATSTSILANPTIDVGAPLNSVAQNTSTTISGKGVPFRLRMALHVGADVAVSGYHNFKLQYAARGVDNVCDTSFSGETYADITGATSLAYADNTVAIDGQALATNANDPTHASDSIIRQEYNEANNTGVTANILGSQDGLWDFALLFSQAANPGAYCLRMVDSSGTQLSSYSVVPQITLPAPTVDQANYRFFANADSVTPGAPLATQDTAATIAAETPFRLRQRLAVGAAQLGQSNQAYKLQYAEKSGVCDVGFAGEIYKDANSNSTWSQTKTAGTAENDSANGGLKAWTNASNAAADDGLEASVQDSTGFTVATNYLVGRNFGFTIPSNATVTGVEVNASRRYTGGDYMDVTEASIKLRDATKLMGTDHSQGLSWDSAWQSWGSNSDTWVAGLNYLKVNSSDFGVALQVNIPSDGITPTVAYVDGITMTVYYTVPSTSDIPYYDNSTPIDPVTISSSGNDPTNASRPTVYQSYRETDPFTNNVAAIPAGSDGLWDFALTSTAAANGKTYCLRVVKSDGSQLDSYSQIPEITFGSGGGGGPVPTEQKLRGGRTLQNGTKSPFEL